MRLLKTLVLVSTFTLASASATRADTYPEVIFDNSLVNGVYAKSKVAYEGRSWVENLNKHLLVSDTLFFTPGNALSLRYKSAPAGYWHVDLKYSRQKFNYQLDDSDFLVLKLYVKSEGTQKKDLPKIQIKQFHSETNALDLASYAEDFEYNMWINVKIPISKFAGLSVDSPITAICLSQNRGSDVMHHMFIDQVEFLSKPPSEVKLSSPAILSDAVAYDQQVHLKWQLPLTPSIRYIKIYRSEDNKEFVPVAIRPIFMQGCLDYVPDLNRTYYYKIAWVDYNYVESPFSEVREVKTKELQVDNLIELVQSTHINYFLENFDINSGMHMPYRMKKQTVVSVKETGSAILSLIIAVEKGQLNRNMALSRISKIVYFLMRSQNHKGILPSYFDGRTGLPHYRRGDTSYDVLATTAVVEALLVARQYFANDEAAEIDLRSRITKLWERVQWDALLAKGHDDVLIEKFYAADTLSSAPTLGGINESINTYMLAMAAPKHRIPLTAYENGIKHMDAKFSSDYNNVDSLANDSLSSVLGNFRKVFDLIEQLPMQAVAQARVSILRDTAMYGEDLPFGYHSGSLLEIYKPFFTINPRLIKDRQVDFAAAIRSYIQVRKRRDNEIGVGSTNSDIWGFYQLNDSIGSFRINPAIAPSSMFLMEDEARKAIMAMYHNYGESFFTEYGFRAWLDLRNNDVSDEYFAINQASNAILIENARTGLIWNLYHSIPEIKAVFAQLFPQGDKSD